MDPRLYEIPAGLIDNSTPIRRFVDSGIQESIDRAVAGLGPEKHGAVILHADAHKNAMLTTVAKLGDHVSVVVSVYKPYGQKVEGEGSVAFSW